MAEITPDPIMRVAMGFMAAKHLFIASETGLFENLGGGPATLDELAAKSGIPHRTLRISADAMVSLGPPGTRRGPLPQQRRSGGLSCRPRRPGFAAGNAVFRSDQLSDMDEAGRRGAARRAKRHFGRFTEEEQQIFSAGVEAFCGNGKIPRRTYDFGRHRRVLESVAARARS